MSLESVECGMAGAEDEPAMEQGNISEGLTSVGPHKSFPRFYRSQTRHEHGATADYSEVQTRPIGQPWIVHFSSPFGGLLACDQ